MIFWQKKKDPRWPRVIWYDEWDAPLSRSSGPGTIYLNDPREKKISMYIERMTERYLKTLSNSKRITRSGAEETQSVTGRWQKPFRIIADWAPCVTVSNSIPEFSSCVPVFIAFIRTTPQIVVRKTPSFCGLSSRL